MSLCALMVIFNVVTKFVEFSVCQTHLRTYLWGIMLNLAIIASLLISRLLENQAKNEHSFNAFTQTRKFDQLGHYHFNYYR